MRQASAEYRCKPDDHRDHGQHHRTRQTVVLEGRGRIDERDAVDGERRGGDGADKRDDTPDDEQHSARMTGQ